MSKPQPIAQPKRRTPQPERAETVGDFIFWDEIFPALGLRNRFGRESWIVQTRIRGSSVRRSLGAVNASRRLAGPVLQTPTQDAWRSMGPKTVAAADRNGHAIINRQCFR
jgi:hypothetical protein